MKKILKNKPKYEYKIAGLDEDGKIIVLVDDSKYGNYTVAINLGDVDNGQIEVSYDFLSDSKVPVKRQEQLIEDVVAYIIKTIGQELENEE